MRPHANIPAEVREAIRLHRGLADQYTEEARRQAERADAAQSDRARLFHRDNIQRSRRNAAYHASEAKRHAEYLNSITRPALVAAAAE